MNEHFELRITRYRDGHCFDQVVELLTRLFPQRARDELTAGLAVTPVFLSHEATRAAAEGLREALTARGATVIMQQVEQGATASGSMEVDEDFIAMTRLRRMQGDERSTAPPRAPDQEPVVKPPWEED
jgi:hypothetical protein